MLSVFSNLFICGCAGSSCCAWGSPLVAASGGWCLAVHGLLTRWLLPEEHRLWAPGLGQLQRPWAQLSGSKWTRPTPPAFAG